MSRSASSRLLNTGLSRRGLLKGAAGAGFGLAIGGGAMPHRGFAQETPIKGGT